MIGIDVMVEVVTTALDELAEAAAVEGVDDCEFEAAG